MKTKILLICLLVLVPSFGVAGRIMDSLAPALMECPVLNVVREDSGLSYVLQECSAGSVKTEHVIVVDRVGLSRTRHLSSVSGEFMS